MRDFFSAKPISPKREMYAYESLWLNEGAWFKNIADLFRENPDAVPSELVTEHEIEKARKSLHATLGDRIDRIGIRLHGAGEYPAKLLDAEHPSQMLYFRGNWELVDLPGVAIVGTRNPSSEGEANAARIARALVRDGYTVVSGLAKGIDTAAHRAALEVNGRTVGVIGTPLFDHYPKENKDLQEQIAEGHLVVSQVPFLRYKNQHYKANSLFFPARNVTMSALTKATIIVEAGNTSGTLVQAKAALAQKRRLFILDSCFRNSDLTWPEKFAKQGAIRARSVSEILEVLSADRAAESAPAQDDIFDASAED